jgi:hypothetical protein
MNMERRELALIYSRFGYEILISPKIQARTHLPFPFPLLFTSHIDTQTEN